MPGDWLNFHLYLFLYRLEFRQRRWERQPLSIRLNPPSSHHITINVRSAHDKPKYYHVILIKIKWNNKFSTIFFINQKCDANEMFKWTQRENMLGLRGKYILFFASSEWVDWIGVVGVGRSDAAMIIICWRLSFSYELRGCSQRMISIFRSFRDDDPLCLPSQCVQSENHI